MEKQAYTQPITECVIAYGERIMLGASDYNGSLSDPKWQETIGDGGEVDDGDFAKDNGWDNGWGNLWDE